MAIDNTAAIAANAKNIDVTTQKIYALLKERLGSAGGGNGYGTKENGKEGGNANGEEEGGTTKVFDEKRYEKIQKTVAVVKDIFGTLLNAAKEMASVWMSYEDSAMKMGRAIGLNREQCKNLNQEMMHTVMHMSTLYGVTEKEVQAMQNLNSSAINSSAMLAQDSLENVLAMSKLVGEDTVKSAISVFDSVGATTDTAMQNLATMSQRAQAYGLNATTTSSAFAKNMELANRYTFKEGSDGISKMTVLSETLRFNMASIGSAADKFSTIEGAIKTSANLQVLGGSFAQQFGNPLTAMYEANNDMEGFTSRITKAFADKGKFNKSTGEVNISGLDMAFIKSAAGEIGMSPDEAVKMAKREVLTKQVASQVKGRGFSDDQVAAISNVAKYENGQFMVHYMENGEDKSVNAKNLDQKTLKKILPLTDKQTSIQKDVSTIAHDTRMIATGKASLDQEKFRAQSTKSLSETWSGAQSMYRAAKALTADPMMEGISDEVASITMGNGILGEILKWLQNNPMVMALGGMAASIVGNIATNVIGSRLGKFTEDRIKKMSTKVVKAEGKVGSSGAKEFILKGKDGSIRRIGGVAKEEGFILKGKDGSIRRIGGVAKESEVALRESEVALKGAGKAAKALKFVKGAGIVGDVLSVGFAAKSIYDYDKVKDEKTGNTQSDVNARNKAMNEMGNESGGAAGAIAGSLAGAAIGSVVPVIGTTIGGIIGGFVGYYGGSKAGEAIAKSQNEKSHDGSWLKKAHGTNTVKKGQKIIASKVNSKNDAERKRTNEILAKIHDPMSVISKRMEENAKRKMIKPHKPLKPQIKPLKPHIQKLPKDFGINGTIKIDMGPSKDKFDAAKLLKNTEFKNNLVNVVKSGLDRRQYYGGNMKQANSVRRLSSGVSN